MRKQTAVEWLVDELRKHIQEHRRLDAITISELKMEAKAMERNQIMIAHYAGESPRIIHNNSIDYYTSTYE